MTFQFIIILNILNSTFYITLFLIKSVCKVVKQKLNNKYKMLNKIKKIKKGKLYFVVILINNIGRSIEKSPALIITMDA